MPDPTTTNIQLAVPTRGSDVGTWDVPVNGDFTLIDAMVGAGITSKSLTNVNISLSVSEAQVAILNLSGTLTGNVQITLPAIYKTWTVQNSCLGNFVITLTGGSGNVIGLPPGSCQVGWDSANCFFVNFKRLGEYWDHPVAAVPAWVTACTVPPALVCDGSTFSAGTYPQLNQLLGGNTLPNAKGAIRATLNQGTSNITTAGSGVDGNTRFAAGGAQNVTLTQAKLPSGINLTGTGTPTVAGITMQGVNTGATSTGVASGTSFNVFGQASYGTAQAITVTTSLGGSGEATPTMPPVYIGGITLMWAV